ncbi:MAG: NAD(P)/FAD-dependent oxidoreductase [Alphaproteobacteria bacterium]|nr:NAD(P)/FAD-dependent oxidoreductase [Alphaproteobacteria bacterium]
MNRRVIIVGAGIAGLSAAHALAKRGIAVRVLEAADQPGGRMAERVDGPIRYGTGARLVYPFSRSFFRLVREMGLQADLVPMRGLAATGTAEGIDFRIPLLPEAGLLRSPVLGWGDRARLGLLLADLLRRRFGSDADDLTSGPDDETLADYIARLAGRRFLERYIAPVFRGTRSWNVDEVSAGFFTSTTSRLLGHSTVYGFRGGIGQLTAALAAQTDVTYGAEVERITPRPGGARVLWWARGARHDAEADAVICAIEGAKVAEITALDDAQAAFFGAVRYNPVGIVHYALREDVAPMLRFLPPEMGGAIATYQQGPGARLFCQLTPEASAAALRDGRTGDLDGIIRADLRRLFPAIDAQEAHRVNQWIAHKLPVPYPGYATRLAEFRAHQESERQAIYFAGDYMAQALVTGACRSGLETGALIARHLKEGVLF